MAEKEVLIEVKNLVKKYGTGEATVFALNNVSMKVYKGEFLIILGYSGSGKSTLLNMIGGIDKVDSGEIIYKQKDVTKFNDKELTNYRREAIGYIFQFFNLLSDITIYQNIVLAPSSTKDIIKNGMVVTVEPGIYIPQKFGVRIEDSVLIKDNKANPLAKIDKKLIVI